MDEQLKQVKTTIPANVHRAARIKAAKTGKPISVVLREALVAWLGNDKLNIQMEAELSALGHDK